MNINDMLPNWLGMGAIAGVLIGIITSCWAKIKTLCWQLISCYGIVHIVLPTDIY